MPDELRKYYSPIAPEPSPEQFADEEAEQEQLEERPESEKRIRWLQEPTFPGAEKHSDGISDLFEGPDLEAEAEDMEDLVGVDWEKDIVDANENGDLEDLVDVDINRDIMGFEGTDRPTPKPRHRIAPNGRRSNRYIPPTGMQGIGG